MLLSYTAYTKYGPLQSQREKRHRLWFRGWLGLRGFLQYIQLVKLRNPSPLFFQILMPFTISMLFSLSLLSLSSKSL